jgi:hypothetical protein
MTPKKGDLIWTKYQSDKGTKYYLLLFLGIHKEDVYGLNADKVPPEEVIKIRANLDIFRNSDLKEVATWIKGNMPVAYKEGFRRYNGTKLFVINNYGLSGTKDLK